jgi:hypothetical protein
MPSDIVRTTLQAAHMRECIVLMDDFGTQHRLYINVTQASERGNIIADQQAAMNARQTELEAYAAANNHDLSAQKLTTIAAKQAKLTPAKTQTGSIAKAKPK